MSAEDSNKHEMLRKKYKTVKSARKNKITSLETLFFYYYKKYNMYSCFTISICDILFFYISLLTYEEASQLGSPLLTLCIIICRIKYFKYYIYVYLFYF